MINKRPQQHITYRGKLKSKQIKTIQENEFCSECNGFVYKLNNLTKKSNLIRNIKDNTLWPVVRWKFSVYQ